MHAAASTRSVPGKISPKLRKAAEEIVALSVSFISFSRSQPPTYIVVHLVVHICVTLLLLPPRAHPKKIGEACPNLCVREF